MSDLLTIRDLSAITGVAESALYRRKGKGHSLPKVTMIGHLVRFERADVDRWVDAGFKADATDEPVVKPKRELTLAEKIKKQRANRTGNSVMEVGFGFIPPATPDQIAAIHRLVNRRTTGPEATELTAMILGIEQ
ncbi:putative DNA-binding transcriptional regulator AlpA [Mycetocola sp. BIGb0189]|uniref:helix-turn-helix transcriptional regulator n=1 Tax=Mycetocola sp. BIGb0189 TaxID=2940604 RepID=UPI00216A0586|nr:helix-turn-helix domain-containing protein [Mycetocola sp. BIGb0189]MCS4277394.1 putative DNA-binding transcriptional regulator AlpA [Mycetocola sp. BIGb0189]